MKKYFLVLFAFAVALFSAGCSDDKSSGSDIGDVYAVVSTVDSGYTSGATSFIDNGSPRKAYNNYNALEHSDHVVDSYGEYFFDIERYGYDAITKFSKDDPTDPIWNYSVMDSIDTGTDGITNPNPYQIVHYNSTKAYVIRYGSKRIWIVNPSTTSETGFKTGSVDLSAFIDASDTDGLPDAIGGVIADGKLYVVCQSYDLNAWASAGNSKIVVIDVSTDTIVDNDTSGGVTAGDAIDLGLQNAAAVKLYDSKIYIACVDDYYSGTKGGIAVVDSSDYSVSTIKEGSCVLNVAVLSGTKGYMVVYSGWGDNALYLFNPTTGVTDTTPVAGITGRNIADIEISPDGKLWIADASTSDPGIYVVDPSADTLEEGPISTGLIPQNIVFVQ